MSFAGSVAAMITSLRNNARPRRKFEDRFDTGKIHSKTLIKKKKISQNELNKIKSEIRLKLLKQRKKRIIATVVVFSIISIIFIGSLYLVSNKTKKILISANEEMRAKELEKEEERNDRIKSYVEYGEVLLSERKYEKAKEYFNKAYILDNKNERTIIFTVKAYILDCLENEKECGICDYYIKIAQDELDNKTIESELGNLYDRLSEKRLIEEKVLYEEILRLLNNGYKALNAYSLKTAEYFIYKAYHLDPENYESNIAVLRIYIEKCLRNEDCEFVETRFKSIERTFGNTQDLKDLRELYDTKN